MPFHKLSRGKGVDRNPRKMFRKNSQFNSNTVENSLEYRNSLENRIYLKFNPLEYPPVKFNGGYEIFAQKNIKLDRLKHQRIILMFGIHIESGIALVNLRESIKSKLDYYFHDLAVSESTDNIIMEIHNNTSNDIFIKKGESLCFVKFIM